MDFVPLHIYSTYSFLKSGLTIKKIADSVIRNDYFGCAISDDGVMFGVPNFIRAMETIKKPYIIGVEFKIEDNYFCLYCKDEDGYLNLTYLSSLSRKRELVFDDVKERLNGLICVFDTSRGMFKDNFLSEENDELSIARFLNDISNPFGDDFYLGVEIKAREELDYVRKIRVFAKEHTYKVVAFPHIKYQKKDDAIVLDIVDAIDKKIKLNIKQANGNQFMMSKDDYRRIYNEEEIKNTVAILKSSTFNFHQKRGKMLEYSKEDTGKILFDKCFDNLKNKGLENNSEYVDRLNYELGVIHSMGYDDYFLLVEDYIRWARENDILVGLRGSATGSLVAYLLNISNIDPVHFNIQFERFLNPSRKTMPDIDIDFMDTRRGEVIEYCRNKYGHDKVAIISTFDTILAKQSLRDIGRVYNYPEGIINQLAKSIKDSKMSLRDSYRKNPDFKNLVDSDKYFLEIVSLAAKIEGLYRQASLHPAGVILNNSPIIEAMPVTYDYSDNLITQYEMTSLEEQGFLKMDFLGLINLTIVSNCVDLINKRHPEAKLDKFNLPYDEEKVYKTISSLNTMGIFQLEGGGMRNAIKVLKPSSFDDVAALLALFRPGPMDEIPHYAKRKEGSEAIPPMSEKQKKILGGTYGIIVYQEQVSELATAMAGMNPSDADNFRRAISKKKTELLSSMEKEFIEGSIKNGYSKEEAKDYFDRINKFASYGFNKSHSYGYALLSCRMAYLKTFYPLEFYTTTLQKLRATNDSKFNAVVSEMMKRDIKLLPPNINISDIDFVISNNSIIFPLNSINEINSIVADKLISERNEEPFADFFDFVGRTKKYNLSEKQIINIIDSGALDCFNVSRVSMRKSIKTALKYAEIAFDENGKLNSDFQIEKPDLIDASEDPIDTLDKEYAALGIMLSNNPLNYMKDALEKEKAIVISQALENAKFKENMKIAGIIREKKTINTKKGKPMAFIKLFDATSELEVIFFSDEYEKHKSLFTKNNIIIVDGYFEKDKNGEGISFIANNASKLEA